MFFILPSPSVDLAAVNSDDETIYPTEVMCYAYDNEEWGDQLSSISTYSVNATGQTTLTDTQTFTYDAMGNPTSYDGTTLTWEGKQLSGAGTTTFSYDENGLRTRKAVNGTVTDYYYNGSVLIGMVTGTGNTAVHQFFSYDASGNVVSVDYSSDGGSTFTTYYYLRNGQNDVVKLIDGSGSTVVEYIYDSWGRVVTTSGTLATTLGLDQPFRYRGYVYDMETGWYYLQSRYYSPETCRFISADVLLSTGQGVLGHNCFAYCLGNPVCRSDSGGAVSYGAIAVNDGWGLTIDDIIINDMRLQWIYGGIYGAEATMVYQAETEPWQILPDPSPITLKRDLGIRQQFGHLAIPRSLFPFMEKYAVIIW